MEVPSAILGNLMLRSKEEITGPDAAVVIIVEKTDITAEIVTSQEIELRALTITSEKLVVTLKVPQKV